MIFPSRAKFNFDSALRYKPVVDLIEKSKYVKFPVLEIGSGGSGISDYFKGSVIGIDTDFSKTGTEKNPNIKYIKGSIFKVPLGNNSFYNVVCLDTLEHISAQKRAKAISELIRVTKKGGIIYLSFPTGKMSAVFEEQINHLFFKKNQYDHPWLKEHKKNGLPEREEIILKVKELGITKTRIKIIGNANLFAWVLMHWLFTINHKMLISRGLKRLYRILFFLFSLPIPPFYRVILVIKK